MEKLLVTALITLFLIACSPAEQNNSKHVANNNMSADNIYFGGTILTMNGDKATYAEAVAVKEGKITFVGSKKQALTQQDENTKLTDLAGKTMMPGFIDPHGHFMFALQMVNQINVALPPVGKVTDIASLVKILQEYKKQKNIGKDEWIVGWGYDQDGLAEKRHITKADLDPYFPDNKVMLIHVSGHGVVLNSPALAWADIDANTKTPAGGVIARVGETNEPAGLLMETAYLPVFEKFPQPHEEQLLKLMKPAQMMYASNGYTHAYEGFTHIKDLDFLQKAATKNTLFLDLSALPAFTEMDKWLNNPKYLFGKYNNHLKLQGIKFTQDGSPQGKTAFVSKPYLTGGFNGEKDWRGETTQPKEAFLKQVKIAFDAGLQVFIHANGDATIDQAITAVENAGITAKDDRRTVVIHSQFQRPDQLPQYVKLGITPSYFTNHAFFWGDVHVKNIGKKAADFISPIKAATKLGLKYSNHTDFNVTPLDPFFVLWTAMARESRSGQIIGADQRIDAYTALQGLTTGPAYQLFEENRKGMIKKGLLADFVILDKNPITTKVDDIRSIKILATIKENKIIYDAGN